MHVLKKVCLDLLFAALLFLVGLFIATAVSMGNKDCITCGAHIATTFWYASMLALQPVLWATGLKLGTRGLVWLCSLIAGAVVYILLEVVGMTLLSSGRVSAGLQVGFLANTAGGLTAVSVSLAWVKSLRSRMKLQPTSPANIGA